ncbi:hypothetical protein BDV93DRAFT_521645 [Ceratobasidium sp. AG-I]|nr:hypothetical protein BDV93DRAFT_521645 [Ceratobasidium sp. AG-I]
MLDEGAVASERASVSWDSTGGQKIDDSAHTPHLGVGHSAPLTAWDDTPSGLCNQRDEEGADENTPMRSVLGQQRLPHHTPTPESEPDNNGSGVVFDGRRQITMPVADATQVIDFEPDGLPNSSPPMASSPQPRVGMNAASTPPSSYEAPPLASPVQLQVESNAQYTPPSSPMKLSSPPPLKQLKKAARIRTGLGAPFRSPFPGPLHYALPSSLPPSSPPPIPTSPPQVQLAKKKRHADSDSEDQPAPTKVRRLGLAPFVSPLRNPQADGATPAKPYTRPPAGGFSTPLRPPRARAQNSNFSSPIVPSQPDVFTTPATASAARSSPACTRPDTKPASSSMFDPTPSSSSKSAAYKPRHPRAVTRPFKPPAKSTRPTSATIQALRQRLQVLRNALRIRGIADPTKPTESSQPTKVFDDDELEALGLQWRTAARDTAQDLWALVRDTASADSWGAEGSKPVGGGKEESWGWDAKPQQTYQARVCTEDQDLEETQGGALFTPPGVDKVHQAMVKNLNRPVVPRKTMLPPHEGPEERVSLQEDEMEDSEHEDEPKHHTLGTMLASLGIPPEVLGWQEEEGEFVD